MSVEKEEFRDPAGTAAFIAILERRGLKRVTHSANVLLRKTFRVTSAGGLDTVEFWVDGRSVKSLGKDADLVRDGKRAIKIDLPESEPDEHLHLERVVLATKEPPTDRLLEGAKAHDALKRMAEQAKRGTSLATTVVDPADRFARRFRDLQATRSALETQMGKLRDRIEALDETLAAFSVVDAELES